MSYVNNSLKKPKVRVGAGVRIKSQNKAGFRAEEALAKLESLKRL